MRRLLLKWGAAALGLAVVILLVLPVISVLQPDYYRRYPTLGPRMDHWKTSTHSQISCGECHIEPGAKGFLAFSAAAVPDFYSQLIKGSDHTNLLEPPSRAACRKCHTKYRTVAPSGDLLIPHRAHVEVLEMDCVACHKDLVHSVNRHGFNRPEMETCLECHNGDSASNECIDCHTRKHTPANHERSDWLKIHGTMSEKQDCGACHDWTPGYCGDCHSKRPASHVGNWKTGHASHAEIRRDGCLVCHGGQKFCDRCH